MKSAAERKEDLLKLLYSYGGACPVKIAVKKMCDEWELDENSQNHIVRGCRTELCTAGLIKPGVRKSSEHLTIGELAEVTNGHRSPYGFWELTPAGKRFVTMNLLVS